jgi:hypothetical protein
MKHDDNLRDPQLSAHFQSERRRVPETWVEDALDIPNHVTLTEKPEPILVTVAPHLGALFLIGTAAWALFHPVSREVLSALVPRFQDPLLLLAGLLTPALLVLCERGFRRFRL